MRDQLTTENDGAGRIKTALLVAAGVLTLASVVIRRGSTRLTASWHSADAFQRTAFVWAVGWTAFTLFVVLRYGTPRVNAEAIDRLAEERAVEMVRLTTADYGDADSEGGTGGADPLPERLPDVGGPSGNPAPAWMPKTVTAWWPFLEDAGSRHGIDPVLLGIVMLVESGGNPRAGSGTGALGLMQVVPRYHPTLCLDAQCQSAFDPEHNVEVGANYLAECMARYGGQGTSPDWTDTVVDAAACYNGGSAGNTSSETNSYRRWVGGMWAERSDPSSPTFDAWMAAGGQRLVAAASQ